MSRNSHSTKRVLPKLMWQCSHFPSTFLPTNCFGDKFMENIKNGECEVEASGRQEVLCFVCTVVYRLGFYYYKHTLTRTYGHACIYTVMHMVRVKWQQPTAACVLQWRPRERERDCWCVCACVCFCVCVCACVFFLVFNQRQNTVDVAWKAWVNTQFWFVYQVYSTQTRTHMQRCLNIGTLLVLPRYALL